MGSIDALTQRTARLLVTRGEHGAHEMTASGTAILPAEKVWLPWEPSSSTRKYL